ncbi:MAG: hypothetical protein J6Y85_01610 [Alphaproteobacteria bacterium]|nr:hypothetical protein [Alphaproteobacteria bacterium]
MQQIDKQNQLRAKIATSLSPWICDEEVDYLKLGTSYIPTNKLNQMNQFVQDQKTTDKQKALLSKTILATGHYHFEKQKITKGYFFLSLPLLMVVGCLFFGIHGHVKKNRTEQLTAYTMGATAYFLADRIKRKFLAETKDSRYFFRVLGRDKNEQQRIYNEHRTWFTQSHQT